MMNSTQGIATELPRALYRAESDAPGRFVQLSRTLGVSHTPEGSAAGSTAGGSPFQVGVPDRWHPYAVGRSRWKPRHPVQICRPSAVRRPWVERLLSEYGRGPPASSARRAGDCCPLFRRGRTGGCDYVRPSVSGIDTVILIDKGADARAPAHGEYQSHSLNNP